MWLLYFVYLILGFASVLYLTKFLKEYARYFILITRLPGPKTVPILGNALDLICDESVLFNLTRHWGREHAPIYKVSVAYFYSVNISGPEEFELVASSMKHIQKPKVYTFLERWLGEGLLTSTGSKWQARRKILTPAFHFSILQSFLEIFNKETDKLVGVLKNGSRKPFVNVVPLISQFTLNTITETSMGTVLDMRNEEDKNYVSAVFQMGKIFLHRLVRPYTYSNTIFYNLFPMGRKEVKLVDTMHKFTDNIISERSKSFEKFDETYNYAQKKKVAMLDLLLNAKSNGELIDDQGIKDEVNTFLFEGHDTTSMSICFTLMLLANHSDIQEQIYQEIITALDPSVKHPSLNDLQELKFMERCIKESLRLYPSVPFIGRLAEEEIVTKTCVIPKGAPIHVHIFDILRNPEYWPEPEKFDPDRFLPENCVNRHPFAYVPFSAGPRNCIGQRYAILEIKAVLFGILKNFILEPIDTPESIVLVPDMVLRTAKEILKVKFTPRL